MEHRLRVAMALALLVAAKLASVIMPFILKDIVDSLNGEGQPDSLAVFPLALLLAYGLARFSTVIFGELRDTLFGRVTERAMRRIGLKVFKHLHSLDIAFHLDRQTGGLSRDIERGTNGISFLMRFMVFNIVPTLLEILMVLTLLVINYSYWFGLIVAVAIVLYIWFTVIATEWRTKYIREANQADNNSTTRAIDSLINFETVKYFNNENLEAKHYDEDLDDWEQARRKNRLSLFGLNSGQAIIIAGSMTSMMVLAGFQVTQGVMTIGDFVLINAFMMQLFMPLNFLGFVYREIKGSLANIERMFGLLDVEPKVQDKVGAKDLIVESGQIEFKQVNFQYNTERKILNGIDFVVSPGEKVALVGSSGAGKSTISKLIFRFYDTTSGTILIDGQNISDVTQGSLRRNIGVVPQDTVLFNDTIQENIRYGRPDATDEEVWKAIEMAHLDKFIQSLPKGVDTEVGERGLKLSGGEKQRVAIARTILKGPRILVFDEATSSLDSESEQAITTSIKEVSKGHSSVVIAHRLSTVIDADRILVLEQGKIVESGRHTELLKLNGLYRKLWDIQQDS